jgi:hypothetical protein
MHGNLDTTIRRRCWRTVATAVAGVLSLTLVVYKMCQPLMPAGSVTSLSGSLRATRRAGSAPLLEDRRTRPARGR